MRKLSWFKITSTKISISSYFKINGKNSAASKTTQTKNFDEDNIRVLAQATEPTPLNLDSDSTKMKRKTADTDIMEKQLLTHVKKKGKKRGFSS